MIFLDHFKHSEMTFSTSSNTFNIPTYNILAFVILYTILYHHCKNGITLNTAHPFTETNHTMGRFPSSNLRTHPNKIQIATIPKRTLYFGHEGQKSDTIYTTIFVLICRRGDSNPEPFPLGRRGRSLLACFKHHQSSSTS